MAIDEQHTSLADPFAARIVAALAALGIVALVLYAYRGLPARPFAADDYQWLLNVRDLSFGELARKAFDPTTQSHFYRPLVWLLFWAQVQIFGLDPRGYHAVSLALHLLNAALLGGLVVRLLRRPESVIAASIAAAIVALHPAPFEAVAWISAQSELLAAALLLIMLHLWLVGPGARVQGSGVRGRGSGVGNQGPGGKRATNGATRKGPSSFILHPSSFILGLALLAKESAAIGLALLVLLKREQNQEPRTENREPGTEGSRSVRSAARQSAGLAPYLLPGLLTLAYAAIQVVIVRRNYLVQGGGYGFGPQIALNPLRGLALLVAPLPGTERADAAWLVPLGAALAAGLLAGLIWGSSGARRLILALLLTLLPTAPFAAPPGSRYLYLPVLAAALLLALTIAAARKPGEGRFGSYKAWLVAPWLLALLWLAPGEIGAREARFAAGTGPGGSLWRVATEVCAGRRPDRMIAVEPPLPPQHVEAIVHLACGRKVSPMVVTRDQVARALGKRSVVIGFPGGSAQVEPPPP